jgi:tRNA pseudouridine55 synthase
MIPLNDALSFLPERRLAGEDARRASHGVAVPGEAGEPVRLVDDRGLIAIAQAREDGLLKPVVGFRS